MLDYVLGKNPIFESFGSAWLAWAVNLIQGIYQKRITERPQSSRTPDFMDKVIQAQKKFPDLVHDGMVNIYLLGNVVAGSDTTATAICSSIYYVLKNPSVHAKLCAELHAADLPLPAKWKDLQKLPYFIAVMREAKRIHPGVGMLLERVVPAGGFDLPDGRYVPEGTIVGMNPWVVNRDRDTFGPDSDRFVPERWLQGPDETEDQFQARLTRMQRAILTFGAGSRSCIGKSLSEMEGDKMVATLFAKYEVCPDTQPIYTWSLLTVILDPAG